MKQDNEAEILSVLKDIRTIIKKQEIPWEADDSSATLVENIRDQIFYALEEKTNWGRNQIKSIIDTIINSELGEKHGS